MKMTAGSILTTLSSNATITMPNFNGGGTPTTLGVTLSATYSVNGLTGSVTFNSDWVNAFGINGLTIKTPAMSITLGAGVSVGFTGGVVLPTDWSNLIGLTAGTPINLTASLGTAASCFGINAGTPGSNTTVLDMLNAGALTASYVSFEIAPTGCTVGTKTIPPGVSLVFDGKVLGTPLSVNASVTPGTPLSFSLDATLGSITTSGFRLDSAHLLINYTPVTKAVSFSASGNVFGVNVAVVGCVRQDAHWHQGRADRAGQRTQLRRLRAQQLHGEAAARTDGHRAGPSTRPPTYRSRSSAHRNR